MPDTQITSPWFSGQALPTGQQGRRVSATFTRPSDTDAYAAHDRIANSTSAPVNLTFANAVGRAGGTAWLSSVDLLLAAGGDPGSFELQLYRTDVSAGNDNAAIAVSDADQLEFLGAVQFLADDVIVTNAASGASGNVAYKTACQIQLEAAATSVFGVLKALDAYAPVSAEVVTVHLHLAQD